jgi:type IV secretion system protein VirB10
MPNLEPSDVPQVTDKRPKITGLLPKHAQSLVLGGVALVMILVILFSGRNTPKGKSTGAREAAASPIEPNQARIEEYRARIDEQARRLATEEAQLAKTKQAFGLAQSAPANPRASATPPPATYRSFAPMERVEPQRSWVDIDREKRQYQSLFASNVALSYRPPTTPSEPSGPHSLSTSASTVASANGPTALASADGSPALTAGSGSGYRLFEGTILETVLTNRLDGSFSGPVNCMVTTNVYSHDGAQLLIPQGTRVLGEVKKLESFGQGRLAVFFHRLIMPDGFSVSLDQFKGLDQIGETGLRDQVNHHYFQIFGVSIAIGAFAGLAQANARYGLDQSAADAYQQGVTTSLSQSSLHILDRYLNVLPTFTIREGYRVKVYLSQDLVLPAYDQHPVREDL